MTHKNAYIIQQIRQLSLKILNTEAIEIVQLQYSASTRRHYRVLVANGYSYIFTYHQETEERQCFLRLSEFFAQENLPAPRIYYSHLDSPIFIQEDLGSQNLLEYCMQYGYNKTRKFYAQTVCELARAQCITQEKLDYPQVLRVPKQFTSAWISNDLWAFKHHFLDRVGIGVNMQIMDMEFKDLHNRIVQICMENPAMVAFVYRDFQARNILMRKLTDGDEQMVFIDYQSAFMGPAIYDLATLLSQVRVNLDVEQQQYLYELYLEKYQQLSSPLLSSSCQILFRYCIFLRYLQLLATYGNRGLAEAKSYFLQNITLVLAKINEFLKRYAQDFASYPYLLSLLQGLESNPNYQELMQEIPGFVKSSNVLRILVQSFSYKQGMPKDYTGNGGGFVWDCRFLQNPGRGEFYKALTGLDRELEDYFAMSEDMQAFLKGIWPVIRNSVEAYLLRNFSNLSFAFGCTGGQHRSVYVANWVYQKLMQEYGEKLELHCLHRERIIEKPLN